MFYNLYTLLIESLYSKNKNSMQTVRTNENDSFINTTLNANYTIMP